MGAAVEAVWEVANCWDGTVTFTDPSTGSAMLAKLYEPCDGLEPDQCMDKSGQVSYHEFLGYFAKVRYFFNVACLNTSGS